MAVCVLQHFCLLNFRHGKLLVSQTIILY
uniref:Uncharacterized protein n=1 Tax=Arundo donax TaxID=35708 RepID=A0A0A9GGA7_ARUDO